MTFLSCWCTFTERLNLYAQGDRIAKWPLGTRFIWSVHEFKGQVAPGTGCERQGPVLWWESQSHLRLREEGSPCRKRKFLLAQTRVVTRSQKRGHEEFDYLCWR